MLDYSDVDNDNAEFDMIHLPDVAWKYALAMDGQRNCEVGDVTEQDDF